MKNQSGLLCVKNHLDMERVLLCMIVIEIPPSHNKAAQEMAFEIIVKPAHPHGGHMTLLFIWS